MIDYNETCRMIGDALLQLAHIPICDGQPCCIVVDREAGTVKVGVVGLIMREDDYLYTPGLLQTALGFDPQEELYITPPPPEPPLPFFHFGTDADPDGEPDQD